MRTCPIHWLFVGLVGCMTRPTRMRTMERRCVSRVERKSEVELGVTIPHFDVFVVTKRKEVLLENKSIV